MKNVVQRRKQKKGDGECNPLYRLLPHFHIIPKLFHIAYSGSYLIRVTPHEFHTCYAHPYLSSPDGHKMLHDT